MSASEGNPLKTFTEELIDFARGGRRGIRNPFVMVPVDPAIEKQVVAKLEAWATPGDPGRLKPWADVTDSRGRPITVSAIRMDGVLPETKAFKTSRDLGPLAEVTTDSVEGTLERNLAPEVVSNIIETHLGEDGVPNAQTSVLVLLGLGSLYPFTRASELLDELDRRNVKTTVGIPFPGIVSGGRLSFFSEDARHYYPAHRIDEKIVGGMLTDV